MMIASANAGMNEGIEYYEKRQEGSKGTLASNENIDKAIEQFSAALLSPNSEKDAALYLLSDLGSAVTGEIQHVDCGYHTVGMVAVDEAENVSELLNEFNKQK